MKLHENLISQWLNVQEPKSSEYLAIIPLALEPSALLLGKITLFAGWVSIKIYCSDEHQQI